MPGISASSDSDTALTPPGRFTMTVLPLTPAAPLDSIDKGVLLAMHPQCFRDSYDFFIQEPPGGFRRDIVGSKTRTPTCQNQIYFPFIACNYQRRFYLACIIRYDSIIDDLNSAAVEPFNSKLAGLVSSFAF